MNINYNKKVLIGVALVLYILYKMMGGWLMKGYLFGLGAMLVGAGLMFVFTHTEVSADSEADAKKR